MITNEVSNLHFRTGREKYSEKYKLAIEMHANGKSITEIAKELGVSYSAVYHWVKGLRKPEAGNLRAFEEFLRTKGPTPTIDIREKFPKHNEIYHVASSRGSPIRRHVLARSFGALATWYYLAGQEAELKSKIKALLETLSKK